TIMVQEGGRFQAVTALYGEAGMAAFILAKGGVRYYASGVVDAAEKEDALRRWAASSALAGVLANKYIGGPDMRIGEEEMARGGPARSAAPGGHGPGGRSGRVPAPGLGADGADCGRVAEGGAPPSWYGALWAPGPRISGPADQRADPGLRRRGRLGRAPADGR